MYCSKYVCTYICIKVALKHLLWLFGARLVIKLGQALLRFPAGFLFQEAVARVGGAICVTILTFRTCVLRQDDLILSKVFLKYLNSLISVSNQII
jgi:hypothetical protein